MNIKQRIEEIHSELISIRRDLHQNPELSEKEFRTQQKIQEFLNNIGVENYICATTGVVGIIRGKKQGKTVGIRADIDALPITEISDKPYCSTNPGVMHACGHDVHTTVAMGVAKIMKELSDSEDSIAGNVKLFFQPAEETIGGAERMVKEGCMKNPDVDYVLGLHVQPYIDNGKIEIRYGKFNAAVDFLKIVLKGRQAHGAYPEKGIDSVVMAGNVIMALQSLVSRNISPLNSVVLTLGTINGGVKENVIAGEVTMTATLRTLDTDTRQFTKARIKDIVENTAKAMGGVGEVIIIEGYKSLINNDEVVDVLIQTGEKLLGKGNVKRKEFPSLGGEDFSYFCDDAKGAFFNLGCGSSEQGITSPIHTDKFDIDEDCLKTGVLVLVENIITLLNK